jgi:hypothetical protein
MSDISAQINYGLWKPFVNTIKAPLFTAADTIASIAAMDKFGKAISMGELGCIPKYVTSDKCKGATSMDFKGTIAERESALRFLGNHLIVAKKDCSKDVKDTNRCPTFADGLSRIGTKMATAKYLKMSGVDQQKWIAIEAKKMKDEVELEKIIDGQDGFDCSKKDDARPTCESKFCCMVLSV